MIGNDNVRFHTIHTLQPLPEAEVQIENPKERQNNCLKYFNRCITK